MIFDLVILELSVETYNFSLLSVKFSLLSVSGTAFAASVCKPSDVWAVDKFHSGDYYGIRFTRDLVLNDPIQAHCQTFSHLTRDQVVLY